MQFIKNKLGISELPNESYGLLFKFATFATLTRMVNNLVSTIYILYFFEVLGYRDAGIIIGISYFLQAFFDYPTGVFSDLIGQKRVLLIAYTLFIMSFLYLSIAVTFNEFLIASILHSLAVAQESGALISWFDNRYKVVVGDVDPEREIYGEFLGKSMLFGDLLSSSMLLVGGYIVVIYGRAASFRIEAIAIFLLMLLIGWKMDGNKKDPDREKLTFSTYTTNLKEGIRLITSNKSFLLFVNGLILYEACLMAFGEFVMFPMYRGFVNDDFWANGVRYSTWILGVISGFIGMKFIKGSNPKDKIPKVSLIHNSYLYFGYGLFLWKYPFTDTLFLEGAILSIFITATTHTLRFVKGVMLQRLYIDYIPDEKRNGFYSLLPTLALLGSVPLMFVAGYIVDQAGHYVLMFLLGIVSLAGTYLISISIQKIENLAEEPSKQSQ